MMIAERYHAGSGIGRLAIAAVVGAIVAVAIVCRRNALRFNILFHSLVLALGMASAQKRR